MATPSNVYFRPNFANPLMRDPYLNFKFIVSWDDGAGGNFTPVAGVSKVGAFSRTTESVAWREGAQPWTTLQIPGQSSYGTISLERGLIIDVAFEQWANKIWFYENTGALGQEVSLLDMRKNLKIELCNQAGQIVKVYYAFNCWPSEYTALPELDASANSVALESMTIQNEGWQRDDAYAVPDEPSYLHPSDATS